MGVNDKEILAGKHLKKLIKANYKSQQKFADDYGLDIRTVSRYVNEGINNVSTIQEFAEWFNVDFIHFFIEE